MPRAKHVSNSDTDKLYIHTYIYIKQKDLNYVNESNVLKS